MADVPQTGQGPWVPIDTDWEEPPVMETEFTDIYTPPTAATPAGSAPVDGWTWNWYPGVVVSPNLDQGLWRTGINWSTNTPPLSGTLSIQFGSWYVNLTRVLHVTKGRSYRISVVVSGTPSRNILFSAPSLQLPGTRPTTPGGDVFLVATTANASSYYTWTSDKVASTQDVLITMSPETASGVYANLLYMKIEEGYEPLPGHYETVITNLLEYPSTPMTGSTFPVDGWYDYTNMINGYREPMDPNNFLVYRNINLSSGTIPNALAIQFRYSQKIYRYFDFSVVGSYQISLRLAGEAGSYVDLEIRPGPGGENGNGGGPLLWSTRLICTSSGQSSFLVTFVNEGTSSSPKPGSLFNIVSPQFNQTNYVYVLRYNISGPTSVWVPWLPKNIEYARDVLGFTHPNLHRRCEPNKVAVGSVLDYRTNNLTAFSFYTTYSEYRDLRTGVPRNRVTLGTLKAYYPNLPQFDCPDDQIFLANAIDIPGTRTENPVYQSCIGTWTSNYFITIPAGFRATFNIQKLYGVYWLPDTGTTWGGIVSGPWGITFYTDQDSSNKLVNFSVGTTNVNGLYMLTSDPGRSVSMVCYHEQRIRMQVSEQLGNPRMPVQGAQLFSFSGLSVKLQSIYDEEFECGIYSLDSWRNFTLNTYTDPEGFIAGGIQEVP